MFIADLSGTSSSHKYFHSILEISLLIRADVGLNIYQNIVFLVW